MSALRVGIVGVAADRGWAREAHVPAVRSVDGLEIVAVASKGQDAADAAAGALGVARAYGDAADLISDEDVDLVTVAASVPAHRELVLATLAAGKHIMIEWAVGLGTAQTEELAARADAAGVHTAVGLQSRMNPAATLALDVVRSSDLGRILSATLLSTTAGFGRVVPEAELYLEDPETGMNLVSIQAAHSLDLAILLAGQLESLSALTTVQYPELEVPGRAEPARRTIADHVLVHGRLAGGGALAAQIAGGRPADDTVFRLDLVGAHGTLTLEGGAPRGFQAGVLSLSVNGEAIPIHDSATDALPDSVVNVARNYAALRDDVNDNTATAPTFDHALRLSHLVDDLTAAALSGATVTASADWPNSHEG